MLFDKLAGMVERHKELQGLYKLMERAHIFEFPGVAHEVLPKKLDNVEFLHENFFLPFDTIAVEDPASVVILQDMEKDAKGLSCSRFFIEALPLHRDRGFRSTLSTREEIQAIRSELPLDTLQITIGFIDSIELYNDNYKTMGRVLTSGFYTKRGINTLVSGTELSSNEIRLLLRNAMTVIEEIIYLNAPTRYILETKPLGVRKSAKGKLLRTDSRSKYTLLTPEEIRNKLNLPSVGSHESPSPHWRRRHYRTFKSDKYVNKKGQTIIIPKMWIGATEYEDVLKKKYYKVRLDI